MIPPTPIVASEAQKKLEARLRKEITDRILREAKVDEQVKRAVDETPPDDSKLTPKCLKEWLEANRASDWRACVDAIVDEAVEK